MAKLPGFSPFEPREKDIRIQKSPETRGSIGQLDTMPLDCGRCGRWLVLAPAFHRVKDGLVCWPVCEDA